MRILRNVSAHLLAIVLFAVVPMQISAQTTRAACDEARRAYNEMSAQLPMQIDEASEMTGARAIYMNGTCQILFQYLIDMPKMYDVMKMEFGEKLTWTLEEFVQWTTTGPQREKWKEYYISQLPKQTREMARIPGFTVTLLYHYTSMGAPPLEVVVPQ